MKCCVALLLAVGLLMGADEAPKPPELTGDQKAIQGTWLVVSMESRGEVEKQEGKMTLTFAGDKVTLKHEDNTKLGTIKMDSAAKPKQLDIIPDDKDAPMKGIYELDGDTLKICTVEEKDGARPATFDSKTEKKAVLLTLKREKAN